MKIYIKLNFIRANIFLKLPSVTCTDLVKLLGKSQETKF